MATSAELIGRLQKVLALTNSPVEGEAQAAAEMLQKLLTDHNLSIADLEHRGERSAPTIGEGGFDLGKAAFVWKLDLAEIVADHYFCYPLIDRRAKTVGFVGRPENVEGLKMLYEWLIDQIKRIATQTRRERATHVDPLRWQVNFGQGAVIRLQERLAELRRNQSEETRALVVHHKSEISDYTERVYGYRVDGKPTTEQQRWEEQYQRRQAERDALKAQDIEAYYRRYPWERPQTAEEISNSIKLQQAAEREEARKERRRQAYREKHGEPEEKQWSDANWVKYSQSQEARLAGQDAAEGINLQPFLNGDKPEVDPKYLEPKKR